MRTETLKGVCGDRWPRLMPKNWAASYCGLLSSQFAGWTDSERAAVEIAGVIRYDRAVLDRLIDESRENKKKKGQGNE